MKPFDGNEDEMRRLGTSSDREIERILTGKTPTDPSLIALADLAAGLRAEAARLPDESLTAGQVAAAAEAVRRAEPVSVGGRTAVPTPAERRNKGMRLQILKNRVVTVASAAVVLVAGATGVAWAANNSGPLDTMYGLDLALEKVGIGSGGPAERLEEAAGLVSSGAVAEGLSHAAEAIADATDQPDGDGQGDGQSASEALRRAATEVSEGGSEQSSAVSETVAALLTHLAVAMDNGGVDGQQVAAIARSIRDQVEHPETPVGRPADTPVGPPENTPVGPPENVPVGPPADVPAGPPEMPVKSPTEEADVPEGIPPATP
jgi:hypothetical protein